MSNDATPLGGLKPVQFVGPTRKVIKRLPKPVRQTFGVALRAAQRGGIHDDAKPLRGFGGAGVMEVVEDFDGNTYREVYTVRLAGVVYVLHVFQKKSTRGIKTTPHDIRLIRARLREAEASHAQWIAAARNRPGDAAD